MVRSERSKSMITNARGNQVLNSKILDCFESAYYPIICTDKGKIFYKNSAALKAEGLTDVIQDLIEKSQNIEEVDNIDELRWKAFKLVDCGNMEVFFFAKLTAQSKIYDVYEQLIRQLAHEFRTPLNSIMGFTEIMLEETYDEAARDYLMSILRASESLVSMLSRILDYGRIAAGKFSVEPSPVDMQSFAELLRFFFLPQARRSDLEFTFSIPDKLPSVLVFDAERVRQILFNLISNALKYTLKGFVRVELIIEKEEAENLQLCWVVKDTGVGLPPQFFNKGVGEYEQGSSGRSLAESAGLGLAIAHRMANALGGSLSFSSLPEGGTAFYFRMNALVYPLREDIFKLSEKRLSGRRILVVDELPLNRKRFKHWLEQAGGEVAEADSINSAIQIADTFLPHAMILVFNPLQLETLREILFFLKRPPLSEIKPLVAILPFGENRQEFQQTFDLVLHQPLNSLEFIQNLISLMGSNNEMVEIHPSALSSAISNVSPSVLQELKILMETHLSSVPGFHDIEKDKLFAEKLIHWAYRQNLKVFITFGKALLRSLALFEFNEFEELTHHLNGLINQRLNLLTYE